MHYFTALVITYSSHKQSFQSTMKSLRHECKTSRSTKWKHKNYDTIYASSFFHERRQILTKHTFVPFINVFSFKKYWFSIKNIWRLFPFIFHLRISNSYRRQKCFFFFFASMNFFSILAEDKTPGEIEFCGTDKTLRFLDFLQRQNTLFFFLNQIKSNNLKL